jgi:hypothetical protein
VAWKAYSAFSSQPNLTKPNDFDVAVAPHAGAPARTVVSRSCGTARGGVGLWALKACRRPRPAPDHHDGPTAPWYRWGRVGAHGARQGLRHSAWLEETNDA